jgi:hypothetical protein
LNGTRTIEVIDTLKKKLYMVPSVHSWSDTGVPDFGSNTNGKENSK